MSTTPQAVVDQLLRMNPQLATKKASKKKKTKKTAKTPRRLTKAKRFWSDSHANVLDQVCVFINNANTKYAGFVFEHQVSLIREWKEERIGPNDYRSDVYTKQQYYIMIVFSYHKRITSKKKSKTAKPR